MYIYICIYIYNIRGRVPCKERGVRRADPESSIQAGQRPIGNIGIQVSRIDTRTYPYLLFTLKVHCAPKWFDSEFPLSKTTKLLVETRSYTWTKQIYPQHLISSCRAPSSIYNIFFWIALGAPWSMCAAGCTIQLNTAGEGALCLEGFTPIIIRKTRKKTGKVGSYPRT